MKCLLFLLINIIITNHYNMDQQIMPLTSKQFNVLLYDIASDYPLNPEHKEQLFQFYLQLIQNNEFQEFITEINIAQHTIRQDRILFRTFGEDNRRQTWNMFKNILYDVINYIYNIQHIIANNTMDNFAYNGQSLGNFMTIIE